jgi:hypothetical protein
MADAILDKGEAVSALVKKSFAKEIELKILLENSTANKTHPWEFRFLISEFSRLIDKVELNDGADIERDKDRLNERLKDLYNKTMQYETSFENPSRGSVP